MYDLLPIISFSRINRFIMMNWLIRIKKQMHTWNALNAKHKNEMKMMMAGRMMKSQRMRTSIRIKKKVMSPKSKFFKNSVLPVAARTYFFANYELFAGMIAMLLLLNLKKDLTGQERRKKRKKKRNTKRQKLFPKNRGRKRKRKRGRKLRTVMLPNALRVLISYG